MAVGMGTMIAIWDSRLSTGDAAIDAEHRLVLNLLNELHIAFTVKAPRVVVQKALEALVGAAERHFSRTGPVFGSPANRAEPGAVIGEHAAFAATVHHLLADWRAGSLQAIDRRTLMNLGRRWISHMGRHETFTRQARPGLPGATRLCFAAC